MTSRLLFLLQSSPSGASGGASEEILIIGFALLICLIAVAAFLIVRRRERKRTEGMKRQAMLQGYSYQGELDSLEQFPGREVETLASLPVFQEGRKGRIRNLMLRTAGVDRDEFLFDYQFVRGSGKNSETVRQTVAAFYLSGQEIPRVEIRPEGFFAALLDSKDIDFEGDREFSKRFLVKGDSPQKVRRFITPSLRSRLVEDDQWRLEADRRWLILYERKKRPRPEELLRFRERCGRFIQALGMD